MLRKHIFAQLKISCLPLFLEFLPVILFVIVMHLGRMMLATSVLILSTIALTVITFLREKRLPYFALFITFLTTLFGVLTIYHRQIEYIQLRDTLYDLICAVVLLVGLSFRVYFLELSFGKFVSLSKKSWVNLTSLWILFFFITAIVNELIRRHFGVYEWLLYKELLIPITIVFGVTSFTIVSYFELKKD